MAYTYTLNANGITANRTLTVPDQPGTLVAVNGSPAVGQTLVWNGSAWAPASAGLSKFTESESTTGVNATTYAESLTANSAIGQADAVFSPQGGGANLAQTPDGGQNGGNKRGTWATDWQKSRSSASQVASGANATISGGSGNTANGDSAVVGGGQGNNASGAKAAIGGGYNNFASGTYNAVGGGSWNSLGNTGSAVGGGNDNAATGDYACIPGGSEASTRGIRGKMAFGSGAFAYHNYDSQMGIHVVRKLTSDATPSYLTATSGSVSTTNVNVLPTYSSFKVRAEIVGITQNAGAAFATTLECLVRRNLDENTTALVGVVVETFKKYDMTLQMAAATLEADTTNGAILIKVTGIAGTDIRWTATMYTTEVRFIPEF